jgi:hypothetical protein
MASSKSIRHQDKPVCFLIDSDLIFICFLIDYAGSNIPFLAGKSLSDQKLPESEGKVTYILSLSGVAKQHDRKSPVASPIVQPRRSRPVWIIARL